MNTGTLPISSSPSNGFNDSNNQVFVEEKYKGIKLLKMENTSCTKTLGTSMQVTEILLKLTASLIFEESGALNFGECVVELLRVNNPFCAESTAVSIAIEGGDNFDFAGTQFKQMQEIGIGDVIHAVQYAERELDLNTPLAAVKFVYIGTPCSD